MNNIIKSLKIVNPKLTLVVLSSILLFPLVFNGTATAQLSGSQFNPGRIIDDAVFYDSGSMNTTQIQQFLNAKMPVCDTNGDKFFGGTTRRQYSADRGISVPFVCLKDFRQDVPAVTNGGSDLCTGSMSGGNKSAAQIINDVSKACGISPKVMLVLLQKEQSLVTDDWPWPVQYRSATGYGCPDSGPNFSANCDASFFGFYNQVYQAARGFKRYAANPTSYNYRAERNNNILFHPNPSCGTSNVFIENQATASLYIYTPYRPNQAALNNLYGTGDGCSAYGNRNFWRMYNDWFGTTLVSSLPGCNEATNTTVACIWKLRDPTTDRLTYVTSVQERETLVVNNGFVFEGKAFFGNVAIAPQPGNTPIYRLESPNGAGFLTASLSERNALINGGFINKGVEFFADRPNSNSGFPVYRLHSPSLQSHAWTVSIRERNNLVASGYTFEGIAFTSISTVRQERAAPEGQNLVYRFSNMPGNSHFWTTDVNERDSMIRRGHRYERVAWNGSSVKTSTEVYRLYSPTMRKHIYTTDIRERDQLDRTSSWNYEGVSQNMSDIVTTRPVYRLYSPVTTNHLWTSSANERDTLVRTGTFRYEGIAWYQP